jgi:hypothetical protein
MQLLNPPELNNIFKPSNYTKKSLELYVTKFPGRLNHNRIDKASRQDMCRRLKLVQNYLELTIFALITH